MLGTFAAAALIAGSSLVVGAAFMKAIGWRAWSGYEAAVGIALLLALETLAIRLPGDAVTAALLTLPVLAAAALYIRDELRRRPPPALGVAGLALLIFAAVPFVVAGTVGVLGVSVNNDMASHLGWAEALRSEGALEPLALAPGYPLGPHALVATVAEALGTGMDQAFTGLLIAIPLLSLPAAFTVLEGLAPARRALGAGLVALPYMMAAYYGQGAFKETLQALFVVAFVALLREFATARSSAAQLVPAVAAIGVGILFNYSYLGLIWPLTALCGWVGLEAVLGRRERFSPRAALERLRRPRAPLARARTSVLVTLGLLAALVASELPRALEFFETVKLSPDSTGTIGSGALGNLAGQLSPFQGLGLWPAEDFREYFDTPRSAYKAGLAGAVGLAAAAAGAWWWTTKRDLVLPAAVGGAGAIYAYVKVSESPYVSAKALAVAAPLVMAMSARAVLADHRPPGQGYRLALGGFATLFAGLALISSFLALRGATVWPKEERADLAELRPLVAGSDVLFLPTNDFVHWALRGAIVTDPYFRRKHQLVERASKPFVYGQPLDFDWLEPRSLDRFDYVVTSRTRVQSEPPANFRLVRSVGAYDLWRRVRASTSRLVLGEGPNPGSLLDCSSADGRRLTRRTGWARVAPGPAAAADARGERYRGSALEGMTPGKRTIRNVKLPPGRYELSVKYAGPGPVQVRAGGLDVALPARLDRAGPLWRIGELGHRGGPLRIELRAAKLRLGASTQVSYVGELAAVRVNRERRLVPLGRACGRYVDWYTRGEAKPPLPTID